MAIVVPVPADLMPDPPILGVDTQATFSAKTAATLQAEQAMVPQVNALASATYQNALESVTQATTATTKAAEALASANAADVSEANAAAYEAGALAAAAAAQSAAGLPSLAGNALKALRVNAGGTSVEWASVGQVYRTTRTSNTIITAADMSRLIDITSGTFTQTFAAAATLGDGWWCYIRNSGTGVITLDPSGSETIDGVTSGILTPGLMILLTCDGVGFSAQRIGQHIAIEVKTSGTSWVAPLGVRRVKIRLQGGGASGAYTGGGSRAAGGAGGYLEKTISVTPGTSYSYSIGAQGFGVSSGTTGNPGGNSTFTANSTTYIAYGGTALYQNYTNAGGNAVNGDVNVKGGAGTYSANMEWASFGGSCPLGTGGGAGEPGIGFGAGGGGSGTTTGSGAPGVLILEY